ncbi:MAG: hypothetical protein V3V10_10675, partial [Planctomycetota bacterium]
QSLKTTATYDEYRAGLENGRDGSGEFRRYLQLTREFEINIGSDPEFDLVHKYVIPDLDFPIGKDHLHYSNIHRWLNYASPMLKQFTKCSEFDFFALDSREQGFSNPDGPKETAWNAGLPDVIFPLRCCFTYSALGQQNKSLQILDAIERATLALRSSTSIDQLLLHFEFDDNYRWASMELAAQGLLDEPRLLRAIDYEPTRKTTLLNTMTGTMLALSETTQEEPLSILDHTVENKYPTAWFSWIRFSSLESEGFRNDSTSGRAEYYLDASSWIDETCKLLPKISAGDHVKSKYYLSHHWERRFAHWGPLAESAKFADEPSLDENLRQAILEIRLQQLRGIGSKQLQQEFTSPQGFEVNWTETHIEFLCPETVEQEATIGLVESMNTNRSMMEYYSIVIHPDNNYEK